MAYSGLEILVPGLEVSVCPVCDERVVLPAQSKRNAVRYADAKRGHDQLKSSVEIIAWRDHLEVTQAQAATLLGGGANAFSKYERGEVIQSRSMDLLMRVSDQFPDVRKYLAQRVGLEIRGEWHELCSSSLPAVSDITAFRVRKEASIAANQSEWSNDDEYELANVHSYG